jgi:hypothetical protein
MHAYRGDTAAARKCICATPPGSRLLYSYLRSADYSQGKVQRYGRSLKQMAPRPWCWPPDLLWPSPVARVLRCPDKLAAAGSTIFTLVVYAATFRCSCARGCMIRTGDGRQEAAAALDLVPSGRGGGRTSPILLSGSRRRHRREIIVLFFFTKAERIWSYTSRRWGSHRCFLIIQRLNTYGKPD